MSENMPAPADRQSPRARFLENDPRIHAVVRAVLGFGRDLPGKILDDETIIHIDDLCRIGGVKHAKQVYLSTPRKFRAQVRAVHMNLTRMRKQAGGRLSWEA